MQLLEIKVRIEQLQEFESKLSAEVKALTPVKDDTDKSMEPVNDV